MVASLAVAWLRPIDAGAARNGTIRGRVELRRTAPPLKRRSGVSDLGAISASAPCLPH
jgi:hypothetical protein